MLKSREIPPKNPRVFQRKVCTKSVLFCRGLCLGAIEAPRHGVYIYAVPRGLLGSSYSQP